MSIAYASWIHGHAGRIEHPDRLQRVWRAGFYLEIRGRAGQQTWLHYAIPTPVLVADERLRAHSVMIRYRVPKRDCGIANIHIYDGENRIVVHPRMTARPAEWDVPRIDIPDRPRVAWGIGVSINVQFGQPEPGRPAPEFIVQLASVGCDFQR